MFRRLRNQVPLMMGGGALLIVMDLTVLLFRAIGLEKGPAIYAALVTTCGAGSWVIRRYFRKHSACLMKGKQFMSDEHDPKPALGDFLRRVMQERAMSGNRLANAAGISEASVRNLLKHGVEPSAPAPSPLTLRAVADSLEIDPLHLFRLAGYVDGLPGLKSVRAEYLATGFDTLSPERQEVLLAILETLVSQMKRNRTAEAGAAAHGRPPGDKSAAVSE
jgi:transcriptional regulator with XRE-family HTH domain